MEKLKEGLLGWSAHQDNLGKMVLSPCGAIRTFFGGPGPSGAIINEIGQ